MDDNGRDEKFQRLLFEMSQLLKRDDVRGFVKFLDNNPEALQAPLVVHCSMSKAKNCLTALVNGRICEPPLAPEGGFAAISIHLVAYFFPDPDIIKIMLEKGATVDLNRECTAVFADEYGTPLYLALASIDSSRRGLHLPLDSWRIGDSIYKLIILLCMWEPKRHLDSVRLLACLNESVNYLAWNLLQNGKLKQLAALLLVAPEEVMAPLETGMTIQQHLANEIESLSSKVDFSHERAQHKSMLMDARQLFDVIERTGDALSSYRTSMLKRIPPEKVLTDVVGLLKRAGFSLQLRDIDLRDCYSGCLALWKPCLDKLADKSRPANNLLHPNPGMTFANIQCRHWNPLLGMLKEGKLLDIVSPIQRVPKPQMLNTVAGSSVLLKHLAYAAFKLKRGSRIL